DGGKKRVRPSDLSPAPKTQAHRSVPDRSRSCPVQTPHRRWWGSCRPPFALHEAPPSSFLFAKIEQAPPHKAENDRSKLRRLFRPRGNNRFSQEIELRHACLVHCGVGEFTQRQRPDVPRLQSADEFAAPSLRRRADCWMATSTAISW